MASFVFDHARYQFAQGNIDWSPGSSDDFRVIMIDVDDWPNAGTTTSQQTHQDLDDIPSAAEVAVSTSAMTGLTVSSDARCDAGNVTISGVTGDPTEALVVYRHTGATDADRWLICYIDNAQVAHTPNSGAVEIQWNSSGIFQL